MTLGFGCVDELVRKSVVTDVLRRKCYTSTSELRGGVWVPTGSADAPLSHGGPHWDVVDKHGNHRNVRPKVTA